MLDDETYLRPVLATFAFALVPAFRDVDAAADTAVQLSIAGPSGGDWTIVRDDAGWNLRAGRTNSPNASVTMNGVTAWQMYVRASTPADTEASSTFTGDRRLASHIIEAFALVS